MRKIVGMLLTPLVLLAITVAQGQTAAKPDDSVENMLIAQERALLGAAAKADKPSFLSLVLVSEGIWATKHGFVPMQLLVDGLEQFQVTKWDIVNPRVTRIDEASAIVVYTWMGAGTFDNEPLASMALASTVWARRNGKWLAIHHQQTDLIKNE
jgi:hypothetical protein